jgi:cytochrome c553
MKLKVRYQFAVSFLIFLSSLAVTADEVDTGALIARCSECHTEKGLAGIPGWPSIAGMNKDLIVGKLKGHRAGLVNDSTMKKVAHDLSDKEIEAVAEHFSTLLPHSD